MMSSETLPASGPGSFSWFESVFNHHAERRRVLNGLQQGFSPATVLEWFQRQVTTLLTERAVGETALTIQPPTRYRIELVNGKPSVVELHLSEFGDLAGNFLAYDQTGIPEISFGLDRCFRLLTQLSPGESVVIYSPASNYRDSGSTSDVINIFTVENHHNGHTTVLSYFLFLNRELSPEERAYWLALHNSHFSPQHNHPREIVAHPQFVGAKSDGQPFTPEEYIDWMNLAFIDRFGKPLFAQPQDKEMAHHIYQKVADHIHHLFDVLLHQGAYALYLALWQLIEGGQKRWAELNQINPQDYWQQILFGMRPLSLGFHPTGGSDLSRYWDPLNNWIGGPIHWGALGRVKHCDIHGDYTGSRCPKCKHFD